MHTLPIFPKLIDLFIYTDGGSRGNPGPGACSFVVADQSGRLLHSAGSLLGSTTNNVAEYSGIIKALEWLKHNNISQKVILFKADSLLIVNQINGTFKVKDTNLKQLKKMVAELLLFHAQQANNISFSYIPRHLNRAADLLVNQTLDQA